MKIASVTFYNPVTQTGGGSVPAYAFKDWCDLIGVDCDVIYRPNVDQLNCEYDAVFFNTPPAFDAKFNWRLLDIPFVFMLHGEDDAARYASQLEMSKHTMCKGLVTIDKTLKFYQLLHEKPLFWYPCCRPENLQINEEPNKNERILYAGRITPWKNPHLLAYFARSHDFDHDFFGRIDHPQFAYKHGIESKEYDEKSNPIPYDKYDIVWGASGGSGHPMTVKRPELATIEAFSKGAMPIVNGNAMPDELKGLFIEVDPFNFSDKKLAYDIENYTINKKEIWKNTRECFLSSNYSYDANKRYISNILSYLI